MAERTNWAGPLASSKSGVVLTGYGADGELCFQEVLSYEDYYEEVGHIFERREEIAKLGIRRIHLVIRGYKGQLQAEHEIDYDASGNRIGGRMRDNPQQQWTDDRT